MGNLKNHPGYSLRDDAAAAFNAYEDKYGKRNVTSAKRTEAQQQKLIDRWNQGGSKNRPPYLYKPAMPARTSPHVIDGGIAVDVSDYGEFKKHCEEFGFYWYGPGDVVHFNFRGWNGAQDTKNRQDWLNRSRGEKLTVDGIQGSATTAAIKRYQTFLGVTADGIWGPGTQKAHQAYYDRTTAPAAPAGDALIRAAQQKLKTNYPLYAGRLTVDGINGPQTRAAVKEFQRRSGLTADGIIGPRTRKALGV